MKIPTLTLTYRRILIVFLLITFPHRNHIYVSLFLPKPYVYYELDFYFWQNTNDSNALTYQISKKNLELATSSNRN